MDEDMSCIKSEGEGRGTGSAVNRAFPWMEMKKEIVSSYK